jgi:hypothetical protein
VPYGSEGWTPSKTHEALLASCARIHAAVQIDGLWRRRYNPELYSLFNEVDIIKRFKINRLRWAGHVIGREKKLYKD